MAKILCGCPQCRCVVSWIDDDAYFAHLDQYWGAGNRACHCKDCTFTALLALMRSVVHHPTSRART